ncbi:nucleotide exchange factor GrpE [bacterium]|nr:nucleotide exchange factor GrpE [bacterium]
MRNWLKSSADPKEMFPIDQLPKETWGGNTSDAVGLLYSKRTSKKRATSQVYINQDKEDFFRKVLPILDGFDNIFKFAKNSDLEENETLTNWIRTLETLYRRLLSALEKEGLTPIDSVGSPLDLSFHEVLDARPTPDIPENTIIEEVVKGYKYGRRILRDAKVVVAKKPKVRNG